jgi:PAS domain S-box-containing protein
MGVLSQSPPELAQSTERALLRGDAGDLEEALENGGVGLHRLARDGTILWANRADYEPYGYSASEYLGHNLRTFHVQPELIDDMLGRLVAGQQVLGLESVVVCRDGSQRHVSLTGTVRLDESGGFVDAHGFTQDISERKQGELRAAAEREELLRAEQVARERLTVLARASDSLAQSLDYERTIQTIAGLALPLLGDFAFFDLHELESVRRVVRACDPEATLKLQQTSAGTYQPHAGSALVSGQSELQNALDDAGLRRVVDSPEQLAQLQALGVVSMLSVPLTSQGETLGALTLFFAATGRQHTEQDLALGEELARRAAAAIVNARLLKEARDAIGVRDDFLSMAGHELRTPLTALQLQILSITKMVGQPDSVEKVSTRAEKAGKNVLRLSALVNELLDISRISAGRLRLERGAMDMADAVREVLHRHADELTKHGCEVHFTAAGDLSGNWDRVRIEQIATNLLANAMKYGKGKPIEVRVQREDGNARLVVQDHGIGISAEDQQRIFQRFERAVSARHFGGLGLGLWIARQLVDAHGGSIHVASEMNLGATFEVVLPVEVPPGDEPEVRA